MNLYLVSTTFVIIVFKKLNSECGLALSYWFFIKSVFSVACTIILSKRMKKQLTFAVDPWVLLRGLLGNSSYILYVYALTLLSIGLVTVLLQTSPFWACVLAYLINREPILKIDLAGMGICFVCVIVIISAKPQDSSESQGLASQLYGCFVCILMAWLFAGGNVVCRKIKHIHFTQIIFVQQLMLFTISSIYLVVSQIVYKPEPS
jgi:drug/metabolite transporter (DMT)-like permease